ncbi:uncharacterized protein K444DRAFT_305805 [Hyaloscypha bicolor E]|uniref:Uncharacterized protein n=1 Tax=Hyaloscypha bicolor E TaxID=1095630 RepID=A0A2J6TMU0_9HELO|nr:uncharacterized protein K444DRAFT_305805 [Hyaloscypha bicolor E]PMD64340.1 hypothetical protein K444DRAFT_305805 [Hyaloscypha bicolor E]
MSQYQLPILPLPLSSRKTEASHPSPGSLTPEQIEKDNKSYYAADGPSHTNTTQGTSPKTEPQGGKAGPRVGGTTSGPPRFDAYTIRRGPGGAWLITCPSDMALKSWTGNGAQFRIKKRSRRRCSSRDCPRDSPVCSSTQS